MAPTPEIAAQAWEDVAGEVSEAVENAMKRVVRKMADDLYGDLLSTTQEYLASNLEFNIASRFASYESEARVLRAQHDELQRCFFALRGLEESGILARAESAASGNPEWEFVSARIEAARTALKRVAS